MLPMKHTFPKSDGLTSLFKAAVTVTPNLHHCCTGMFRCIAAVNLRTPGKWNHMGSSRSADYRHLFFRLKKSSSHSIFYSPQPSPVPLHWACSSSLVSPKRDTVLQMQLHKHRIKDNNHIHLPPLNISIKQDLSDLICLLQLGL